LVIFLIIIMKKISVIIPSFSPSFYIQDCLNSISNQTFGYDEFEVLIVLNGPKEPYWEYLNNLLGTYTFCYRLLYSDIPSVSNARNMGLKYASGEYIAFVDDDDYVSNSYLSDLYKLASKNAIVVCNVHSFNNIKEQSFFLNEWLKNHNFQDTSDFCRYRSILSVPWAKLIPRTAIGNHSFDMRFTNGEDALFITSITNSIKKLRFTNTYYYVRIRHGSASRKKVNISSLCKDTILLILEYIHIYFNDWRNYNFSLFVYRIPGVIKNFFILLNNGRF